MEINNIVELTQLRIIVGYLGEKDQFDWWQSSFFTQGSSAFLSPMFSRTKLLAQCKGVTQAAALVHDERIGVGHVYHLFRLPEELEQGIHQALHEIQLGHQIQKTLASKVSALEYLKNNSTTQDQLAIGPTRVGDAHLLRDFETWKVVAGLYSLSFEKQIGIFPYFTDMV